MDAPHHMAAIMEVDLRRACHPNTLVDRINAVPAFKTSAAFFSFLRANLVLPHSEMSSNVSTPVMAPIMAPVIHTTTTSRAGAGTVTVGLGDILDDIPPLTLSPLTTHADKVDALQLVADSVAQQRQVASRSLVFHPLCVAGLATMLGAAYQLNPRRDLGTMMGVMSGVTMIYLLGIRYCTAPYIALAESIDWNWLQPGTPRMGLGLADDQDTLIGARFGREMIGALVLRLQPGAAAAAEAARKKNHSMRAVSHATGSTITTSSGYGEIRAWTTKLRYRRRGIGGDLLEEAVRVTRERCGKDATLAFAPDHANSHMVLPAIFNETFRETESLAARALKKAQAAPAVVRRKR